MRRFGLAMCGFSLGACTLLGESQFDRIDGFVESERRGSHIPGIAIAIVNGEHIVHARGFGDDGNGRAITQATPFWIGSNTKSFTSLAIMQLVEARKIELDAPVVRYLPEFRAADSAASSRITIRHLLNQTSGFSRQSGLEPLMEDRVESLEGAVAGMRTATLNRAPGESFEYSNLNAVILGRIIERVSGKTWQDYVKANILVPLGMTNAYTSFEQARLHGMTAVHRLVFGFPIKAEAVYLPGMAPSGYLVSSAEDMARYLSFYLKNGTNAERQLISPEGIAAILTPETNATSRALAGSTFGYRYGRGWFVGPFGVAEDARWHLGQLHHFNAWMVLLPESNQGVVVLINAGSFFEIGQANSVLSRIPIGIVNMLRGSAPPAGIDMGTFFAVFDIAALLVVLVLLQFIYRTAKRKRTAYKRVVLELGLGVSIVLAWPLLSGMGWRASFRALPDLTLVVALVAALLMIGAAVGLYGRAFSPSGDFGCCPSPMEVPK